jgi:acetyltransferase-like isoleucine patch superfamily enzyme
MNKYKRNQFKIRVICSIFGSKIFSFPLVYKLRNKVYRKIFNIGEGAAISHNVWIYRVHGLEGEIRLGKRSVLERNVEIDFSGGFFCEDDVWLSEGCKIHTHMHKLDSERLRKGKGNIHAKPLILKKGCWLGSEVMVLPQVSIIGENSIIGARTVVTKDVPPNVVMVGNPGKIKKSLQ